MKDSVNTPCYNLKTSTAVLPKAEENDVALSQIEEELKQKEGVLKEEVMAAAPAEKAMKEVEGDWLILYYHHYL